MSDVLDRFLKYVKFATASKEKAGVIPSTPGQFDLARVLTDELRALHLQDVHCDEHCIVSATLPSNLPPAQAATTPVLMFNAHLDTSMEESGENVKPQLVPNYPGGDITLPNGLTITEADTPALAGLRGHDIITTDGTTLLGADDKAGIAEIMAALAILAANPSIPHGKIRILFTPDEETGTSGATLLDAGRIGADCGYTVDGEGLGYNIETFHAIGGTITVRGYNCHPGFALNKMVNSLRVLPDVLALFPEAQAPETTQLRQGYYHPYVIDAAVRESTVHFLLRDFDRPLLDERVAAIREGVLALSKKYPRCEIVLTVEETYRNMREVIEQHPQVVAAMEHALAKAGVPIRRGPIRGGTDGSLITFMGVPTPNLGCGVFNAHSRKELVSVQDMESTVQTILHIIEAYTAGIGASAD